MAGERKKEIRQASMIIAGGKVSSENFVRGAEWADGNPSPKVLEKGMKKLGLRTDLDGNVVTRKEFVEVLKNRDAFQKEMIISKAVEWLKGHAYRYKEHTDTPYNDLDLVRDFIVAMEEDK